MCLCNVDYQIFGQICLKDKCIVGMYDAMVVEGRSMRVRWKDVFQKLKNMTTFPLKVDKAQNRILLLWKVTFAGAGNYNVDLLIGLLFSVPYKKYNWLIINMKSIFPHWFSEKYTLKLDDICPLSNRWSSENYRKLVTTL